MRVFFAAVLIVTGSGSSILAEFKYQTIDFPGATFTWVDGVEGNLIVGTYATAGGYPYHGFVYDGTSFATIDFPGSRSTAVLDVDGGRLVGYYDIDAHRHGFMYENGVFTSIDDPLTNPDSFNGTVVAGISGNRLVGSYIDTNSSTHGFVYDGSSFTTLTTPFFSDSNATAIDGNTIVGDYSTGGFVFDGGNYEKFNYPGSTNTEPYDISGGKVVGYYTDAVSKTHGFLFDGKSFLTLNDDTALGKQFEPTGIDGSTIVGQYLDLHIGVHGFVTTITVPEPSTLAPLLYAVVPIALNHRRRPVSHNRV